MNQNVCIVTVGLQYGEIRTDMKDDEKSEGGDLNAMLNVSGVTNLTASGITNGIE